MFKRFRGQITLKTLGVVRSPKLSSVETGQYLDEGGGANLGKSGTVRYFSQFEIGFNP